MGARLGRRLRVSEAGGGLCRRAFLHMPCCERSQGVPKTPGVIRKRREEQGRTGSQGVLEVFMLLVTRSLSLSGSSGDPLSTDDRGIV